MTMPVTRRQGMDLARSAAWAEHGRQHRYLFTMGGAIARVVGFLLAIAFLLAMYAVVPHLLLGVITGLLATMLFAWVAYREAALGAAATRSKPGHGVVSLAILTVAILLSVAAFAAIVLP